MAEFPSLPLFTDAYLGDTTHLSTFEHGAYLLLLIVSWRSPGCRLPDDDAMLARYTRMTRDKWRKTRPVLASFFAIEDGFWHQARLQNELQHLQSRRKQQVEAGNASAIAKSLKRGNRKPTSVGRPLQREVNGASTPIPIPSKEDPLDKESNGEIPEKPVDPEAVFWRDAKAFLKPKAKGDPGAIINKWMRDHGKEMTVAALNAAQLERAFDPIAYVGGYFRRHAAADASPVWDGMP